MNDHCTKDCSNCPFADAAMGSSGRLSNAPETCSLKDVPKTNFIKIAFEGCSDFLETAFRARCDAGLPLIYKGYCFSLADFAEMPDVIIDTVDCMNLEESLLRTTYLMDQGCRMVLAFHNYEQFRATNHDIRHDTLSLLLGLPAVHGHKGLDGVLDAVISIHENRLWLPKTIHGLHIDEDKHARQGFVAGALQETVIHSSDNSLHTIAQKADALLTNKWLGIPLLALVLFAVFEATFALGAYPQKWIESGVDALALLLRERLADGWFSSMLVNGIIQGVGAVLSFLPNIAILFFFLSMLEDSGYMARAAYVMDKIMHRIGLHGNSFIPMLIGFGCNVPAIMAARNIQNAKDRTLTMLMIPFMSCSARLPVYMLFVSAFFVQYKALVMMGLYVTGVVISILFAFLMKRTKYFRKGVEDYVSELPPFHAPKMKDTWSHIWDRVKDYLQKISSVILLASIVIWALEYFPASKTHNGLDKEASCLATIGKGIEPVMKPLGFDWKMNVCLLTGLPAKEAIVSTMGILYHTEDEASLTEAMRTSGDFNLANSLSFLIFVLLYFPCVATISTLRREAGLKWAVFTVVHTLILAWLLSFAIFQGISLFL